MPSKTFDPASVPESIRRALSSDTPAPAPGPTRYAMMSMHRRNRIRFLQFPESVYLPIDKVIVDCWKPGIEKQEWYAGSYEYAVEGTPFGMMDDEQAVAGRRLIRNILAHLYAQGWLVVTELGHSRKPGAKDSVIFKQVELAPPPTDWLVVALTRGDRLRFIYDEGTSRLSNTSDAQPSELGILIQTVKKRLEELQLFQTAEWNNESFAFKMNGLPWQAQGESTMKVRLFILRLLETLESFGWSSYASLTQRTGSKDCRNLDTWYFVRAKDWVAGSPFNDQPASRLA